MSINYGIAFVHCFISFHNYRPPSSSSQTITRTWVQSYTVYNPILRIRRHSFIIIRRIPTWCRASSCLLMIASSVGLGTKLIVRLSFRRLKIMHCQKGQNSYYCCCLCPHWIPLEWDHHSTRIQCASMHAINTISGSVRLTTQINLHSRWHCLKALQYIRHFIQNKQYASTQRGASMHSIRLIIPFETNAPRLTHSNLFSDHRTSPHKTFHHSTCLNEPERAR